MKKILLMLVLVCCMLTLVGCEAGNFLSYKYIGKYYTQINDGDYITEEDEFLMSEEDDSPKMAYHTLVFGTDPEVDIKNKLIGFVAGGFYTYCEEETEFHIEMKWSQGFWYKDKVFIDEYFVVSAGDGEINFECQLAEEDDPESGFKIPSNNDATITITISAFVDDVEVKDYSIALKHIQFIVSSFEGDVPEDESLKQDTEETKTE